MRLASPEPEEDAMKLPRRQFLHLAAGAAALPAVSRVAWAQTYPSRPVRIIVGFAAGGPNDILARLIGQWLSERLGQPFVIENRPGAGSNIATEAVVRAPPDGYTLLLVGSPNAINATLYDKLNFNFIRDIAPVASFIRGALVMVVHPSVPAKTVPEFIAYAKANPGKLSYGSGGVGGITHITAELFKMMAGVDMVHVPYRGVAPALTDLLGGQVQVLFANPAQSIRLHQGRQAARSRDNHRDALGGAAGHPDRGRVRPGLRGKLHLWLRRAQGYARRNHRQAEQGDQCRPRRSQDQGAACRPGRHGACWLARRFRQAHRRGNREVGKGDPGRPISSRSDADGHVVPQTAGRDRGGWRTGRTCPLHRDWRATCQWLNR